MDSTYKSFNESVYFYTFHKCASSLFSGYILPNVDELKHVDYARQIYSGAIVTQDQVTFEKFGHVYGPIRISANRDSPANKLLVVQTTDPYFIQDKKAVFFLRDPRDILVSSYYSMGFSHEMSPVLEVRNLQGAKRDRILEQSIDEYALGKAEEHKHFFQTLDYLATRCEKRNIMRYEDMIENFDLFSKQISECIPLRDEILSGIYKQTRPKIIEDIHRHRRSGRVGGFRDHLKSETIESLNNCFRDILARYGYSE